MKKIIILVLIVIFIVLAIVLIESTKPNRVSQKETVKLSVDSDEDRIKTKEKKYKAAKEIVRPSGFINSEQFKLADLIGQNVILLDFWTYSCINCQRTTPYLNGWYEKYHDSGLEIVGMHAPEFFFEKDYDNVQDAVERFEIKFPVVQDNDFATWQVYGNHHWPHKYLIDIDGFIVYDHIGEGGYEETEKEIQKALEERKIVLGTSEEIGKELLDVEEVKSSKVGTPEIYFGSERNKLLANGIKGKSGIQDFAVDEKIESNKLYLEGKWEITGEYAQSQEGGSRIVLKYFAKDVFMVASGEEAVAIKIKQDGKLVENGTIIVGEEMLYHLIKDDNADQHLLEIEIEKPGLNAFTFTFG